MNEVRPNRLFHQLSMSHEDAYRELQSAGEAKSTMCKAVSQITELLLEANLTPLQAQAVLVGAWRKIQMTGHLSPIRQETPGQEPNRQREAQRPPKD